jgi:hypothetical protein
MAQKTILEPRFSSHREAADAARPAYESNYIRMNFSISWKKYWNAEQWTLPPGSYCF